MQNLMRFQGKYTAETALCRFILCLFKKFPLAKAFRHHFVIVPFVDVFDYFTRGGDSLVPLRPPYNAHRRKHKIYRHKHRKYATGNIPRLALHFFKKYIEFWNRHTEKRADSTPDNCHFKADVAVNIQKLRTVIPRFHIKTVFKNPAADVFNARADKGKNQKSQENAFFLHKHGAYIKARRTEAVDYAERPPH